MTDGGNVASGKRFSRESRPRRALSDFDSASEISSCVFTINSSESVHSDSDSARNLDVYFSD